MYYLAKIGHIIILLEVPRMLLYKSATGYQGFFEYGVYFFKTIFF